MLVVIIICAASLVVADYRDTRRAVRRAQLMARYGRLLDGPHR